MPSDFLLVATMNPCPCGNYLSKDSTCICSQQEIKRYFGRLSWPMLDRIDMTIYMNRVEDLEHINQKNQKNLTSKSIYEVIERTRLFSIKRQNEAGSALNVKASVAALLTKFHSKEKLSMRAYNKLINLSRTIADMALSESIEKEHVLEAMTYLTAVQVKRFFS